MKRGAAEHLGVCVGSSSGSVGFCTGRDHETVDSFDLVPGAGLCACTRLQRRRPSSSDPISCVWRYVGECRTDSSADGNRENRPDWSDGEHPSIQVYRVVRKQHRSNWPRDAFEDVQCSIWPLCHAQSKGRQAGRSWVSNVRPFDHDSGQRHRERRPLSLWIQQQSKHDVVPPVQSPA